MEARRVVEAARCDRPGMPPFEPWGEAVATYKKTVNAASCFGVVVSEFLHLLDPSRPLASTILILTGEGIQKVPRGKPCSEFSQDGGKYE